MKMVILGALFGLLVILIYGAVTDDSNYDSDWNSNCQYGNEYMRSDGTIVKHSDCK